VVDSLAAPGEELADRGFRRERLEQLHIGRPVRQGEHGLTHALLLVGLATDHAEAEHRLIPRDRGLKRLAGDPHMIDTQEHAGYLFR
jgi:hypothetical protein